jgi:hypothetical protein
MCSDGITNAHTHTHVHGNVEHDNADDRTEVEIQCYNKYYHIKFIKCNLHMLTEIKFPNFKVHKLVEKYKHGASHDQVIFDQ